MSDTPRAHRPGARTATGLALAATMLTTAGVAAQSPSTTTPDATQAPTQASDGNRSGTHRGSDRGARERSPGFPGPGGRGVGGRAFDGFGIATLRGASGVTVSANDGTNLGLQTADGWTRTIDTTGVALSRDGVTIAPTDILVGERVRVVQTRNADGTYTVTGIEVQPSVVSGTVGTVATDGFTVVASDGTTTVTVTPETTWSARGSSSVAIADATAGRSVTVEGQLQPDGSIVATRVRLG